ncbi:MAG: hypothetical protein GXP49_09715 [Deltaproteobacteria bacterium]|nr:hypothetical protein [Deltaproteobacteria bacterium]
MKVMATGMKKPLNIFTGSMPVFKGAIGINAPYGRENDYEDIYFFKNKTLYF